MHDDEPVKELIDLLRRGDEASAYNAALQIVSGDREKAVLAPLQLASTLARQGDGS